MYFRRESGGTSLGNPQLPASYSRTDSLVLLSSGPSFTLILPNMDSEKADSGLAWLEITLESIDPRYDVLLCNRTPIQNRATPKEKPTEFWDKYVTKLKGVHFRSPRRHQTLVDVLWTFMVSLSVCLLLTSIDYFIVDGTRFVLMIPSFAVMAALIFDNFTAPLAQPRNIICGNLIGAIIACTIGRLFDTEYRWLTGPLAVSSVGALQMLTGTIHPPGGSIALYILYGPQKVRDLGFLYIFMPVLIGSIFFVVAATLALNLFPKRFYPKYWT